MRHLSLLLAIPLVACGGGPASGGIENSPQGERSFALTGFSKVVSAAPASVRVTTGSGYAIRASGSEKMLERLEMRVDNGTLRIGLKKGSWSWTDNGSTHIDIAMPKIEGASIAGAGEMTIDQGTGDFTGDISGSGELTIGQLRARNAKFSVSGAGEIAAAGSAETLNLSVGGSGSVRARELTSRSADIRITGTADVVTTVDGDANVSASGAASVDLGDRARCRVSKSGPVNVKCGG